eukprot:scaffold464798_cov17-Prasinocladus_malaysianus.AAC.1
MSQYVNMVRVDIQAKLVQMPVSVLCVAMIIVRDEAKAWAGKSTRTATRGLREMHDMCWKPFFGN